MSCLVRIPVAAVALFLLTNASPTPIRAAAPAPPATKNVTLPYPAKVPAVLTIYGIERSRNRLAQTLKALPPADAATFKKELDGGLDELLKGRKLTAVGKDARAFVVVHDIARLFEVEPAVAVLIPVTNYKDFRGTFLTDDERKSLDTGKDGIDTIKTAAFGGEHAIYLVDLKEYVVLTADKSTAEVYTGKYTRALTGSMGPDIANSYLAADVALYVNMDVINDLYGDQIRQFKGLIDFALMQAQAGGMLPGLNKEELEAAKVVLTGLFQAVEDSQGVLLAVEFRPEGVNLRAQLKFVDDSPTGKMLKPETPDSMADISKLPRGFNNYGGTRLGKKFTDLFNQFTTEFAAPEDNEKASEQIKKLQTELVAAGSQWTLSAGSAPESSLAITGYQDATKAASAYTRLYKAVPAGGRVHDIVVKQKPTVTEKAQTIGGFTLTEIQVVYDFEATVKDLPDNVREATLSGMKRMTREKVTYWIGTDGKVFVQLTGKDWDAARKSLDQYLSGNSIVASAPGYQVTRKNLPATANVLLLFETGELIVSLLEQAKSAADSLPGGGGGLPPIGKVKPVKGEPTYVGLAVTLKQEIATIDVFVPGTALNVAAKMLTQLFKNVD